MTRHVTRTADLPSVALRSIRPLLLLLLLAILELAALTACGQSVYDRTPEKRDARLYPFDPPKLVNIVAPAPVARRVANPLDLTFVPDALVDTNPTFVTLAWEVPVTGTNGFPTGYNIWGSSPTGLVLLLCTNLIQAVVLDEGPRTFYVSATNQWGTSPLSLGLVYPKPTTNVLRLTASITNWPALSWTNQQPPFSQQFLVVKYASTNRASVVFSSDLRVPLDTWQVFPAWPEAITTRRDIKLGWTNFSY